MAKYGVSLKIDVSKIDKNRLFRGQKGTYLDATVFIDADVFDQYGNSGMITQDVSKDEKQQGVKGNILGNCKVFWVEGGQVPQQQQAPQQQYQQPNNPNQPPPPPQDQQMGVQQAQPQSAPAQGFDGAEDEMPF